MRQASASLEVELPRGDHAPSQARAVVAGLCDDWDLPGTVRPDLLLLVSEVVTNAVIHFDGSPGLRFLLTVAVDEQKVRVTLADSGTGFTGEAKRGPGGYGIYLLDKLASHWGVEQMPEQAGRTRVWFELSATRYPYSSARRHRLAM